MRAALLLLALSAGSTPAQSPLPVDGSELFCGVLHRLRYTPAGDPQSARVVIIVGLPVVPTDIAATCRRVLDDGGALLVVANEFPGLQSFLPGRPDVVLRDGSDRGFEVRTLTAPFRRRVGMAEPTPADGLGLTVPAQVVVGLPAGQVAIGRNGQPWLGTAVMTRPSGLLIAAAGAAPGGRPGRAVAVASTDLFTNGMIAGRFADDSDTGNLEFAFNVARWLRPPGNDPVPCLFVDRGRTLDRFDAVDYTAAMMPQLPTPAPPPLSAFLEPEAQAALADAANETLDQIQTDDRLNAALVRGRRYGRTVQWLLGVLAVVAVVALVRRARAARRPTTPPPPAESPRPAGSFGQRREELLRAGDHTAAVREYLVEFFRHQGLQLDEFRHPTRMPRVEADADTRRRLATLWEAAYGPAPISYTRWKELEPMIETVRADAAAGRWRFARGRA